MLKPSLIAVILAGLLSLESVPVLGKTMIHLNPNNERNKVFKLPPGL